MTAMQWLPPPADFRRALRQAAAVPDPNVRVDALIRLAQHRLSYLETIRLDRLLRESAAQADASRPRIRLAVLAAATIDHLLPAIRVAGLRRGLLIDVYAGRYGQYRQELLDPASPLADFAADLILLSPSGREAVSDVRLSASRSDAEAAASRFVGDLRGLWQLGRERLGAGVIQQSLLDVTEPLFGNHEPLIPGAPAALVGRVNARLAEAAAEDGVLFLDVARASARDGIDTWFDAARWLQGKLEISPAAAGRYGELTVRLIAAQLGRSRKCLVLDLDNTLWGGVVGDDGIDGIVLGEGSAAGEAHLALQVYAKRLAERGVILAVCSKNDPAIAAEAFDGHPEMRLKRSDLAAFVANWNDKTENLEAIARRLNIGLDSVVFVDDNPAERARIRQSLPMVAVPELPADPAHYVRCIADAGYFESISFTDEDRRRKQQYAANARRDAVRASAQSMEEYLCDLAMSVTYGTVLPVDLPRAVQLINKTNQFNTTTRRMQRDEVAALAASPANLILHFRLADRFGDNGLVSVMLLCRSSAAADVMELRNWVMSCRVFGRRLEHEAMNIAVEEAARRGVRAIEGDFIPTDRNGVIGTLFADLGFTKLADGGAGVSRWRLALADYRVYPTQISRKAQTDDQRADIGQTHEYSS